MSKVSKVSKVGPVAAGYAHTIDACNVDRWSFGVIVNYYTTQPDGQRPMQISWNDTDPIYRQLYDRMIESMLDGIFDDGDVLPSVRQVASDYLINPITVSKAYQMLVDDGLVEKRRGLGMFVVEGAATRLASVERNKFLTDEWPRVCVKIERLGLSTTELLAHSVKTGDPS